MHKPILRPICQFFCLYQVPPCPPSPSQDHPSSGPLDPRQQPLLLRLFPNLLPHAPGGVVNTLWRNRVPFKTPEELQREKDVLARVNAGKVYPIRSPIFHSSLSKANPSRTSTGSVSATPCIPTVVYSVGSSDTEEELAAEARPICQISDVRSLAPNHRSLSV